MFFLRKPQQLKVVSGVLHLAIAVRLHKNASHICPVCGKKCMATPLHSIALPLAGS